MLNFKSIKIQLIVFLLVFAGYLAIIDKDSSFLISIALAVLTAVGLEAGLAFVSKRQIVFFKKSAIITGLIIGFVLSSGQSWYIYLAASILAIGSKYIIRFHKKHVFNPAAFGILLATILLSATTQWKGTYQWYILLPAGLYFTYRIRKMEALLGYAVVAMSLWGVQALLNHVNVIYIFGYLSYFFIFIMLIEPKTTPTTQTGKIAFGGIVAVSIFILTELGVRFDVELCGLLIGNAAVPLLNKFKQKVKGA